MSPAFTSGEIKGKTEIAKNCLFLDIEIEHITNITGLSENDIKKLII